MPTPLLSIGIPTYNRVEALRRAVESALAQDCGDLELVVADNASTDGTEAYCRALAAQDPRVRYIRHPANRGPTANFNSVLRLARGDYFLFLSDDDWLHPAYASSGIAWLRTHPGYAMAGGHPTYLREDGSAVSGLPIDLRQASAERRVHAYFRDVDDGAAIYGVLPRAILERVSDIRNVVGNDWLFVAEIAALGRIAALADVHLFRSLGGTSASYHDLATTLGLPRVQRRFPFLTTACAFAADAIWRSPVHRATFAPPMRFMLVALCAASMARRQLWLGVLSLGQYRLTRRPYGMAKAIYHCLNDRVGARLTPRFPGHSTAVTRSAARTQEPRN